jgi:hypothetical protein
MTNDPGMKDWLAHMLFYRYWQISAVQVRWVPESITQDGMFHIASISPQEFELFTTQDAILEYPETRSCRASDTLTYDPRTPGWQLWSKALNVPGLWPSHVAGKVTPPGLDSPSPTNTPVVIVYRISDLTAVLRPEGPGLAQYGVLFLEVDFLFREPLAGGVDRAMITAQPLGGLGGGGKVDLT